MKKFIYLLPLLFLASCTNPAFQEGGWIIPLGLGLAATWTWTRFFFGVGNKETKKSMASLVYASILTIALVVVYLMMRADA